MSNPPTPYTQQALRSCLHTVILGRRIEMHTQVGSTNDLARQAGRRGEPEGLIIVAEEQTAGRGRLNRVWTAPPGCCVLCSVLLRPRFAPHNAFYLTVAAALAVYRACGALLTDDGRGQGSLMRSRDDGQEQSKIQNPRVPGEWSEAQSQGKSKIAIKWPNDVLVNGRKVAGVLCETEMSGYDWGFAVVGLGINANLEPTQLGALQATAASLSAELGRTVDRAALLCRVLGELEDLYLMLQNGQFGPIYSQWAAVLETIGKRVSVQEGTDTVEGHALRVDLDGALVLRLDDGTERRILAGDVT